MADNPPGTGAAVRRPAPRPESATPTASPGDLAVETVAGKTSRAAQAGATRGQILAAAERLFAERGVNVVSNRQVSDAAGQGNNAAVLYHFGTKTDLVRAIARKHAVDIERHRVRLVARAGDSTDIRDWVVCLVRPLTDHLATLGSPTWYARFCAQVMSDPALQQIMLEESFASPTLQQIRRGTQRCLAHVPDAVRADRGVMARQLIVHMCAERERALAEGTRTPRPEWHDFATDLIDAIAGLLLAPVTPSGVSEVASEALAVRLED